MTDLERQCEEIRKRRMASTKVYLNGDMLRDVDTLLACIAELRRPSDAKEIAQIQERQKWRDRAVPWGQTVLDIDVLLAALAESQREYARLTGQVAQWRGSAKGAELEIARLGSPPEERRDIAERQPALRYTLVSGNWNDACYLIQKAIADIGTLLEDCARHRNAHAVNMARADAAEKRVAELKQAEEEYLDLTDSHHDYLSQRIEVLTEALQALYSETADYITINHLGPVHWNHSMQMARAALAQPQAEQKQ